VELSAASAANNIQRVIFIGFASVKSRTDAHRERAGEENASIRFINNTSSLFWIESPLICSLVLVVLVRNGACVLETTVLGAIVSSLLFPYNRFTMLPYISPKVIARSARWLGLGVFLAALPFSVMASPTTVTFDVSLNSLTGSGEFTYESTPATSDSSGGYVDAGDGNLDSFDLTYDGTTYTMAEALDAPTLPTVFLPGNTTIPAGLQYGFLAFWVVSGSCSGGGGSFSCSDATILGLGRTTEAFLVEGVSSIAINDSGSNLNYNIAGTSEITGTVTGESAVPEPAIFPVTALALAGLWFARRRKAIL
jgi:hypothetical protein